MMLLQFPPPAPGQLENWLIPAAAVASLAVLAKQLFGKKRQTETFVTKTEFHQALEAVRDKIDARFLALSEKLDTVHDQIARIEASVARLDERTRN